MQGAIPTQSHNPSREVDHTTGVYVPYSFQTLVWVLLCPTSTDQWKCCEMGPVVFCPYPRRLESLTICWCLYKGSTFFSVIKRSWVLVRPGFEPATSCPDVTGMYRGIMLIPREGHKMKQKTDKAILIINAILFIFFEPAIVVNRYMTCALFKLDFQKKNWVFFKKA